MSIRKLLPGDETDFLAMSDAFYHTDACDHVVDPAYARRTFKTLMAGSPYIDCLLYTNEQDEALGFALLAHTWSNEAGGMVVWVEELYVRDAARGQGVGHSLLAAIHEGFPDALRFRLEVTPANARARALYATLGYKDLKYEQMVRDFAG